MPILSTTLWLPIAAAIVLAFFPRDAAKAIKGFGLAVSIVTFIISLGIVTRPFHLLVIEIAVAILTLQAIAINRLAGIDYPLWALRDGPR